MASEQGEGIRCPDCGTLLHEVLETRKRDGYLYRRRRCFNGHGFGTREGTAPALFDMGNALDRVIAAEQARVEAMRAEHPEDMYLGLMQLEDIELLKQAAFLVRSVRLPAGDDKDEPTAGVEEGGNG